MFAALRHPVPGTGLRADVFTALTLASIATFLWWGGALWSAPTEDSHVARFVASYLLVVPAAAVLLVLARAWALGHLVGTVGAVWAIKMVVTAVVFGVAARGTATTYDPARAPVAAVSSDAERRRADEEADEALLESADPHAVGARVALVSGRVDVEVVGVDAGELVMVDNRDAVLHTAILVRGDHTLANVPLPPRSSTQLGPFPAGVTEVRCAHHPDERFLVRASASTEVPRP